MSKMILATRSYHSAADSFLEKCVVNMAFGTRFLLGFSRTADITAVGTARAHLS
jgi:hypothetical protein